MAQVNTKVKSNLKTHEGGPAKMINAEMQLRRAVLACLLWEDTFYESGVSIADRIADLVTKVDGSKVMALAEEARKRFNLRHAPLYLLREATRHGAHIANALANTISRADELAEFVSIYWKDGKQPLSAQVKRGLAKAFTKFDEYQLAKYDRAKAVRLKDTEQQDIFNRLVNDELASPETWENRLSRGEDKKTSWETMLAENQLGALALLRNLRNMNQVGVDENLIKQGLKNMKTGRVLPFRFIPAERYAPMFSAEIEGAMLRSLAEHEKLSGRTILLVDISGSMTGSISVKSEMSRIDAASALAILVREIADARVFTFSNDVVEVPSRHGFALRDAINSSQWHGGTNLGGAVNFINTIPHDRLIVFTDEQAHDRVPDSVAKMSYVVNVASYKNGVGYGKWLHIDGFSEAVVDYILEYEKEFAS
jgi:hypothetical protein